MSTLRVCRIGIAVDDMPSFTREVSELLGVEFRTPQLVENFPDIFFNFGEHGLLALQLHGQLPSAGFGRILEMSIARSGRLIQLGINVEDAEATRQKLHAAGCEPIIDNYLPLAGGYEYQYGRDFHNLPFLVCRGGDNEIQMRADGFFRDIDTAPNPKIGCISLVVDNLEKVASDLGHIFGMQFVNTDPAGLGEKALVGAHRIKLIENPYKELSGEFELPLAAIEFAMDDVEQARERFEAAGYPVRYTRALNSGGNGYYFGATVQRMPISIYPGSADQEIIGQ